MRVDRMSHGAIATALSYEPGTRTDRIAAALRHLENHGFIAITRRGARRCDRYQILIHPADHATGQASGYDVVPYAMRHALRTKTITPTVLVSWLRLEQVLGAHGWTTNTLTQLATRCTTSTRTLATHITTLTLTGFLTRTTLPTGTTLLTIGPATDSTPTNTPTTTSTPTPTTTPTTTNAAGTPTVVGTAVPGRPATSTTNQPANQPATHPKPLLEVRRSASGSASGWGGRSAGGPEETAGSPRKKVRGLNKSLTHEGLTHENSLAGFAKRSHLGKGLAARTGRERPKPTNTPIHTRPRTHATHATHAPAQAPVSDALASPATRHPRSTQNHQSHQSHQSAQNTSSASSASGSRGSRGSRPTSRAAGGRLRNAYTHGPISRRDVRQVLTTIPTEWISGPHYRWLPGLAGRIATWLDGTSTTSTTSTSSSRAGAGVTDVTDVTGTGQVVAAMTASAIIEALTSIGSPDYLPASVLASADIAIAQMRAEQRAHLRCTTCGHTLTTPEKRTATTTGAGQCWACHETASPALPTHIAYPDYPDNPENFDEHAAAAALRALPLDQRIDLASALIDLHGRHQAILTLLDTDPDVATHFINQDHQNALATNGAHRVRTAHHANRTTDNATDNATNDSQQDTPSPIKCRTGAAETQRRGSRSEDVGHSTITRPAGLTLITPLRLIEGILEAWHRQVNKGLGLRCPSSPCAGETSRATSNAPRRQNTRPVDRVPLHTGMHPTAGCVVGPGLGLPGHQDDGGCQPRRGVVGLFPHSCGLGFSRPLRTPPRHLPRPDHTHQSPDDHRLELDEFTQLLHAGVMASSYTLLAALTTLDSLRRERLDRLICHPGISQVDPRVECHLHPAVGAVSFGGEFTGGVPLAEQVAALTESGLWGGVVLSDPDEAGRREVRLWAGKGERAAFDKRVTASLVSPRAAEVLAAGGDVKLHTWRRQQAMERLERSLWDVAEQAPADGAGPLSRGDLVAMSQTARATVYKFLGTRPDGYIPPVPALTSTAAAAETPSVVQRPAPADTPAARPTPARHHAVPTLPRSAAPAATTTSRRAPARRRVDLPAGQLVSLHGRVPEKMVVSVAQAKSAAKFERSRAAFNDKSRQRFAGIAAAIDDVNVYLPNGRVLPWEGTHLGDVAALAGDFRLGWGGGERLPHPGEVWVYPEALERLGLPIDIDLPEAVSGEERAKTERAAFDAFDAVPAVADARVAGWSLGGKDRLSYRMRMMREGDRRGVNLVVPSWAPKLDDAPLVLDEFSTGDIEGADVSEAEGGEVVVDLADPDVLVARLQEWIEWVRVPYQLTPAVTGMALIDYTRPPRASAYEDRGRDVSSKVVSARRDETPDQPPFKAGRSPQYPTLEGNFSWWRRWDALTESERAMTYVHAYDHRSHVLNPWMGLELGIEGLEYRAGADAFWPGDEAPGYYLVSEWVWDDWTMPDPGTASYGWASGVSADPIDDVVNHTRTRWVTGHTLKQLEKLAPGFTDTLTFHESYRWAVTGKYLTPAGELLREARNHAPAPVADTAKTVYAGVYGKLRTYTRGKAHLHRPDWYDMIAAAARTTLVAALVDARTRTGATPLVVDRDTIVYLSNDPDPRSAWPGNPDKLDSVQGGWRPTGTARLADWGPAALADHTGAWEYTTHMTAMTPLRWRGEAGERS